MDITGWQIELEAQPQAEAVGEVATASWTHVDDLDAIAERVGVTPLSSFLSPSLAELEVYDEALAEGLATGADMGGPGGLPPWPEGTWFDPESGLATVTALLNVIRAGAEISERETVEAELAGFEQVLSGASGEPLRWRLAAETAA